MNFQARKQIILAKVDTEGSVDVKELAIFLQTSEITIRRDLAILAEKGLVFRTHGGAMKVSIAQDAIGFAQKSAVNAEQKDYICQIAAQQIHEGDSVFMDCGSTVFRLCALIRHKNIQVVTNSLPVVNQLINSSLKLNFVGGEIDHERQAAHGLIAVEHINRYKIDKAFLGVGGMSLKNGLSAANETESQISMAMASNAQQRFFLCDSSKLEKDRYFPFAPLAFAQTLITDNKADATLIEKYREVGLKILF